MLKSQLRKLEEDFEMMDDEELLSPTFHQEKVSISCDSEMADVSKNNKLEFPNVLQ